MLLYDSGTPIEDDKTNYKIAENAKFILILVLLHLYKQGTEKQEVGPNCSKNMVQLML